MASETCPRSSTAAVRRVLGTGAALAGLASVLTLTACSGDDSSDGSSPGGAPSPSSAPPSASSSSAATDGGTGGASAGDLDGSWFTTTDGKAVALVVNGEKAGLFVTGGSVCAGSAGGSGRGMIELTCTDGSEDRTKGTVESLSGKSLVVTWDGLGKETYTKAEGGRLPSGFPTSTLGILRSPNG